MSNRPLESEIDTSTTTAFPARMETQHMSRRNKSYLINDNEFVTLKEVTSMNSALWSSFVGCVSMILAAVWDSGFTPEGDANFASNWCWFWGLIAMMVGIVLCYRRGKWDSVVDQIKAESYPSQPSQSTPDIPDSHK